MSTPRGYGEATGQMICCWSTGGGPPVPVVHVVTQVLVVVSQTEFTILHAQNTCWPHVFVVYPHCRPDAAQACASLWSQTHAPVESQCCPTGQRQVLPVPAVPVVPATPVVPAAPVVPATPVVPAAPVVPAVPVPLVPATLVPPAPRPAEPV